MNIERIEIGPRMSKAVVHGATVYLAGQVAEKAAGKSDFLGQFPGTTA